VADRTISDDELIEAVVAGDASVASELYDRLHHSVDRTIYRVLGRREGDHEDLVQTAFEQIVKTLATRRFARACSLKTWACSVATHVGLNALRSRRRERGVFDRRVDEPDGPADFADPEREASARREMARIRKLLGDMSPGRAEALFLHDVLGYELAEIAALTGVSIAAAQSRLVRGRHELHAKLGIKKRGEP
jgi:RNA polymerase sigma-70 factor (ECF subfamily)